MVGLFALGAAWFGGERFILRQVRMLCEAARKLGAGELTSRTGLSRERGELGELARALDAMAASLEQRVKEREQAERTLLNRSFQQTVVSALGQFAMVSNDLAALLDQAVMLAAQTLEVEYCHLLELQPGGKFLLLRAGVGWKDGWVGKALMSGGAADGMGLHTYGRGAGVDRGAGAGEPIPRFLAYDRPRGGQRNNRGGGRTRPGFWRSRGAHGAPAEIYRGRDPFPVLAGDGARDGGGTAAGGK